MPAMRYGLAVMGFAAAAVSAVGRAGDGIEPEVAFVSAFTMNEPRIVRGPDWPFGGISGIDCVGHEGGMIVLRAVSDDRAEFAPARTARILIPNNSDPSAPGAIPLVLDELSDETGASFETDHVDPEGVRVWPGEGLVFWSSEGRTREGVPPAVFARDSDGATVRLPLPGAFVADHGDKRVQTKGVRNNRGFEALAFEPGEGGARGVLYAGIEEPLTQDESERHTHCRVIRYDLTNDGPRASNLDAQRAGVLLYPLGPAPGEWIGVQNGLTELVSLGGGRLLALERAERMIESVPHYNVRLYLTEIHGAAGVPDDARLSEVDAEAIPAPMRKSLLFDFDTIADRLPGGRPMNFEGMTLLPDGTLLVCSDNDHGVEGPTVFVRLRLLGLD